MVVKIKELLETIQKDLFNKAKKLLENRTKEVSNYDELKNQVETGFAKGYWCENSECEEKMSQDTKASIRCIPFEQESGEGDCVVCGQKSKVRVIFARAY